jgi:hypothetical protein
MSAGMAVFMSRPDTTVRIAFDLAAGGAGNFFTLDDPVLGELDDAPFGLAGDILEDVTAEVRSVSVRRGRSRELERFQAGAAKSKYLMLREIQYTMSLVMVFLNIMRVYLKS